MNKIEYFNIDNFYWIKDNMKFFHLWRFVQKLDC